MSKYTPSRTKRELYPLWLRLVGVLTLLPFLGCCSDSTGPSEKLVPAFITGFNLDDPHLQLSVAGLSLSFEAATYGNSCRSKGETEIVQDVENHKLILSPFDRITSGPVCLDLLQTFIHSGTVILNEGGLWTVVLAGQEPPGKSVEFSFEVQAGWPQSR